MKEMIKFLVESKVSNYLLPVSHKDSTPPPNLSNTTQSVDVLSDKPSNIAPMFADLDNNTSKTPQGRRSSAFRINRSDPLYPTTILNTPIFSKSLEKLSLYNITEFINMVRNYEAQHGVAVRMSSHFSSGAGVTKIGGMPQMEGYRKLYKNILGHGMTLL